MTDQFPGQIERIDIARCVLEQHDLPNGLLFFWIILLIVLYRARHGLLLLLRPRTKSEETATGGLLFA